MQITLQRINQAVRFEGSDAAGHTVVLDGGPDIGGEGLGIGPRERLLMSLASCSGMETVAILRKMRQPVGGLRVVVDGERTTDGVPAVFRKIHMAFHFRGALRPEKVAEALRLSVGKYCSVARMLEKTAVITHDFSIEPAA